MSFITYTHNDGGPGFEVRHLVVDGHDIFGEWLDGLRDARARALIHQRIERAEDGNLGDHRSIGGGVWEMRVHAGPGYRIYFAREGKRLILILCGGNKTTQRRDIEDSKEAWRLYRTKA